MSFQISCWPYLILLMRSPIMLYIVVVDEHDFLDRCRSGPFRPNDQVSRKHARQSCKFDPVQRDILRKESTSVHNAVSLAALHSSRYLLEPSQDFRIRNSLRDRTKDTRSCNSYFPLVSSSPRHSILWHLPTAISRVPHLDIQPKSSLLEANITVLTIAKVVCKFIMPKLLAKSNLWLWLRRTVQDILIGMIRTTYEWRLAGSEGAFKHGKKYLNNPSQDPEYCLPPAKPDLWPCNAHSCIARLATRMVSTSTGLRSCQLQRAMLLQQDQGLGATARLTSHLF